MLSAHHPRPRRRVVPHLQTGRNDPHARTRRRLLNRAHKPAPIPPLESRHVPKENPRVFPGQQAGLVWTRTDPLRFIRFNSRKTGFSECMAPREVSAAKSCETVSLVTANSQIGTSGPRGEIHASEWRRVTTAQLYQTMPANDACPN